MGITYGDHLIDIGHREYTEEEERQIVDRRARRAENLKLHGYAEGPKYAPAHKVR